MHNQIRESNQAKLAEDLNYSSIQIGQTAQFSRLITDDDILQFANLTGDFNPLHVDHEYASKTQFKDRVAHGMLIGSLFSTLVGMHLPGKKSLYLSQSLNFIKPVRAGDEVMVSGEVVSKVDALQLLVLRTKVFNKAKEVLIDGEAKVKVLQ